MGGRRKGSRGELEVAKLLERWWCAFEPHATFVRTPLSGGWSHAPGFRARGDVMVGKREVTDPDPRFPFTVEVKRREAWSEERFLRGGQSPVWQWWRQVARAAADDGAEPLLVFRRNRGEWLALVGEDARENAVVRSLILRSPVALLVPTQEWPFQPARPGRPALFPLAGILATPPAIWAFP